MRNLNKLGYKFKFELRVESVDKMINMGDVCLTWERGPKVLATKPTRVDKSSRTALFEGQLLAQDITLFKKKKEGSQFDPKVYKLAVRQGNQRGKVVGRIEINFADYVEIPSFSKRIGATLSSGSRLIMNVTSTFLGEAKKNPSSHDSTSIGSSAFELESDSQSYSAHEDPDFDSHLHELDDLSVNNLQVSLPPTIVKKPPHQRRNLMPGSTPDESPQLQNRLFRKQSSPSPRNGAPKISRNHPSSLDTPPNPSRGRMDNDTSAGGGQPPSRVEFDKLRRENRVLRRKADDLESRNSDLERRFDGVAMHENGSESIEQLMVENTSLRRDIGDLEAKLAREPVYADVVRDLREAKMALAILTLEKDELTQEVRRLRRR